MAVEPALFSVQSIQRDRLLVLNGTLGIDNVIAGSIRPDVETARGGTRLLLKHWAIGELALAAQERFTKGWNGAFLTSIFARIWTRQIEQPDALPDRS